MDHKKLPKRRAKRQSVVLECTSWDCSVCTFQNTPEAFKCLMCNVRKGTSTRKPRLNSALIDQQAALLPGASTKTRKGRSGPGRGVGARPVNGRQTSISTKYSGRVSRNKNKKYQLAARLDKAANIINGITGPASVVGAGPVESMQTSTSTENAGKILRNKNKKYQQAATLPGSSTNITKGTSRLGGIGTVGDTPTSTKNSGKISRNKNNKYQQAATVPGPSANILNSIKGTGSVVGPGPVYGVQTSTLTKNSVKILRNTNKKYQQAASLPGSSANILNSITGPGSVVDPGPVYGIETSTLTKNSSRLSRNKNNKYQQAATLPGPSANILNSIKGTGSVVGPGPVYAVQTSTLTKNSVKILRNTNKKYQQAASLPSPSANILNSITGPGSVADPGPVYGIETSTLTKNSSRLSRNKNNKYQQAATLPDSSAQIWSIKNILNCTSGPGDAGPVGGKQTSASTQYSGIISRRRKEKYQQATTLPGLSTNKLSGTSGAGGVEGVGADGGMQTSTLKKNKKHQQASTLPGLTANTLNGTSGPGSVLGAGPVGGMETLTSIKNSGKISGNKNKKYQQTTLPGPSTKIWSIKNILNGISEPGGVGPVDVIQTATSTKYSGKISRNKNEKYQQPATLPGPSTNILNGTSGPSGVGSVRSGPTRKQTSTSIKNSGKISRNRSMKYPARLKNVDRSSGQTRAVTVNSVTVFITEYRAKPIIKRRETSTSERNKKRKHVHFQI